MSTNTINTKSIVLNHGAGGSITFPDGSVQTTSGSSTGTGYQFDITALAYGADKTGVADSADAIQAAVDAAITWQLAQTNGQPGVTVYFPEGTYKLTHPIHVWGGNLQLLGAGSNSTFIKRDSSWLGGSAFVLAAKLTQDLAPIPVVSPLLTPQNAQCHAFYPDQNLDTQGPNEYEIATFTIGGNGLLNGKLGGNPDPTFLTQFTAECTVKLDGDQGAATFTTLMSSFGRRHVEDTNYGAFFVGVRDQDLGTPHFYASVTTDVTGTVFLLGTTHILVGTQYHVAVTYDGSHAKLWVNGVEEAAASCTGKILQNLWEDFVVAGQMRSVFPQGNLLFSTTRAIIDSPRVSAIARYSSTFTPPSSQFTPDSNTVFLTNFEMVGFGTPGSPVFCKAYIATFGIGSTPVYLFVRRNVQSPGLFGNTIKGFNFGGLTGIEMQCINNWEIHDIQQQGGGVGIVALNNCFTGYASRMYFLSPAYCGVLNFLATGLTVYENWQFTGNIPLGGLGFTVKNAYFQYTMPTFLGAADPSTDGGIASFESCAWADEGHTGSLSPVTIRQAGCAGVQFKFCTFEKTFAGNDESVITVSGTENHINFDNCIFNGNSGVPSIFDIKSDNSTSVEPAGAPYIMINGAARWRFGSADPTLPLMRPDQLGRIRLINTDANEGLDYNILDYGARANSPLFDSRAAIQASINAAKQWPAPGPLINTSSITLGAGQFFTSKPLLVWGAGTPGLHIHGAGKHTSMISPLIDQTYNYPLFRGPLMLWGKSQPWTHFGSPLVGSTGHSAQFTTFSRINIGETYSLLIDGLSQFSFEGWVKVSTLSGSSAIIAASDGFLDNTHIAQAFSVYVENPGGGPLLKGFLRVGGVDHNVGAFALTFNTTYHVELSYDGAHIRFFINGVVQDTVAATGNVNQAFYEDFFLGAEPLYAVNTGVRHGGFQGLLDSVRFSNTARHTSNFIPPAAKYATDSNTLLLLNFDTYDTELNMFVGLAPMPHGDVPCYMGAVDALSSTDPLSVNSVKMSGITLNGAGNGCNGMLVVCAQNCTWEDMYFFTTGKYAIHLNDVNSFYNWASDIYVQSNSLWGCQWDVSNGNVNGENLFLQFAAWIASFSGSWNSVHLQPSPNTALPARITTNGNTYSGATIRSMDIDAEVALPSNYLASVICTGGNATGAGSIVLENCFLASEGPGSHTAPAVMYDNLDYLEFKGCRFRVNLNAPAPYVFQRLSAAPTLGKKISIINCTVDNDFTSAGVAFADHFEDFTFLTPPYNDFAKADIRDFGARPWLGPPGINRPTFSNSDAIQKALDSLPTDLGDIGTPMGTLYIPSGDWAIDRPINLTSGRRITGDGRAASNLICGQGTPVTNPSLLSTFAGPMIVLGPGAFTPTWGPDLFGGAGRSIWIKPGTGDTYYLSDSTAWCNLNGASQFSLELKLNMIANTNACWVIGSSGAKIDDGPTNTGQSAFGIETYNLGTVGNHNRLRFNLTTSNGDFASITPTEVYTLNTPFHVSINYNGSFFDVFIDGVNVIHVAATGTLVQHPWESCTIGGSGPEVGAALLTPVECQVQAVRLSNVARHTGTTSFTPPSAPYTTDSNTLALLNWDQGDANPSTAPWIIGQASAQVGFMGFPVGDLVKHYIRFATNFSGGNQIDNIGILSGGDNAGIIANTAPISIYQNLYIAHTSSFGLATIGGAAFYTRMTDIDIFSPLVIGCAVTAYSGENITVTGGRISAWLVAGVFSSINTQPSGSLTEYGVVCGGGSFGTFSGVHLTNGSVDSEGSFPNLKAGMLFAGDLQTIYTSACNMQGTTLGGVPCVLIAGLRAAAPAGWTSINDLFLTNPSATGLIEKVSTAVINGQILLIAPNNTGSTGVPWTSTLTGQILQPTTSILA